MEEINREPRKPRKLDVAESASIDIVGLNNKVVKMRSVVRKAKYQTVQKMVRTIEGLRKKKGSEEQLEKNKRKVDRLLEEIKAIKTLRANKVSKFSLANTSSLDEICKKPDASAETRALVRLTEHQALKVEVNKFREEHDDWKSLVEYLLGHVARRFYKNKHKVSKFKMAMNVTVGNQLVKSYLEHKVGTNMALKEKDKIHHDTKNKLQKSSKVKDNSIRKVSEGESMPKMSDSDEESSLEEKLKHNNDSDNNDSEGSVSIGENSDSDVEEDQTDSNPTDLDNDTKEENEPDTKIHGEMVVKKLNMEELKNNNDVGIPAFLITNEHNDKHVKKSKDSFFMCEDDENKDNGSDSHPVFHHSDNESDSSNIDDERRSLSDSAMRSSFIGALNATRQHGRDIDVNSRQGRGRGGLYKSGKVGGSSYFEKSGVKRDRYFDRKESFPGKFSNLHQKRSGKERGSFQSNERKNLSGVKSNKYKQSVPKDSAKTVEKIHPSWEASKKRKEHSSIQTFQGKKIKFDDDD